MDLTPIIYSSMLVVFSLLCFVILVSFVCSKLSFCSSKTNRRINKEFEKSKYRDTMSEASLPAIYINPSEQFDEDELITFSGIEEEPISFSFPKVKEEFVKQNMVNYTSEPELLHQDILHRDYINSASRYSVVNSYARIEPYSKMSFQYS